jgi:hypothetical protein
MFPQAPTSASHYAADILSHLLYTQTDRKRKHPTGALVQKNRKKPQGNKTTIIKQPAFLCEGRLHYCLRGQSVKIIQCTKKLNKIINSALTAAGQEKSLRMHGVNP